MGRVIEDKSPPGSTVNYEWVGTGCGSCGSGSDVQLTKITDPGNNIWEFKYDIMGNAIEMIYPDGSKIKQAFDMAGRLKIFTNKRNQSIHYSYDADGLMVKKSLPEGDVLFTYDDKDRVTSIQGADYHYSYQYGSAGGIYGNSLVHIEDFNTGLWSQHVYNRYGLPIEYYDSFQWKKSYMYNFTQIGGTPIGFTPYIVSYHKFYSQSGQYKTIYTYDQGLRLYRKRNDYLKTERRFFYDSNGPGRGPVPYFITFFEDFSFFLPFLGILAQLRK